MGGLPLKHNTEYHKALNKCSARYLNMYIDHLTANNSVDWDKDPLYMFIWEFLSANLSEKPIPKLCRWLGYIQGCLIERNITSVEAEREWTRPLFRHLDFN